MALPGPLPRTVPATLIYRLTGLPPAFRHPDARQTFAPGPGGATLVTVRVGVPAAADPAKDTPRSAAAPDPEQVASDPGDRRGPPGGGRAGPEARPAT